MKVLLVCSGGMSTSILIDALKKEATKKGIKDFEAIAVGAHEMDNHLADYEYVLVAPQIKHKFEGIKAKVLAAGKKAYSIPPMEYTPIGAPKLFNSILSL